MPKGIVSERAKKIQLDSYLVHLTAQSALSSGFQPQRRPIRVDCVVPKERPVGL